MRDKTVQISHRTPRDQEEPPTGQGQHRARERKGKWPGRIFRSSSHRRLASSLAAYRIELNHLEAHSRSANGQSPDWAVTAHALLDRAEQALSTGEVQTGWYCFLAAQRIEILGLGQAARQAKAQVLRREASEKLYSWRKQAAQDLLCTGDELKPELQVPDLYRAAHILHEHYQNVYHKLGLVRRHLGMLAIVGLLAATLWVILAPHVLYKGITMNDPALFIPAVLFGVMGASISGILTLSASTGRARIPDQLTNLGFILARLAVGAIAALTAHAFLASGLLRIAEPTPWLMMAVSFVAGFSDQFLVRAVGAV